MVAVVVATFAVSSAAASGVSAASTPSLALCGNSGAPTTSVQHVLVVMLENQSYPAVVGTKTKAPYENGTLATQCGLATQMYGATHTSAANYLAMSAGAFPSSTVGGCSSVSSCSSSADNIYRQLDYGTGGWKAYEESMPSSCYGSSAPAYKIGHNPPLFYGLASCGKQDVGVPDLTAQSGALWTDLNNQTLPAFSFVTPNLNNDGEGTTALAGADAWLQKFLGTVQKSASYQSGSTVVIVSYDEGSGSDAVKGEDCTNKTRDLAGSQPSCHVAAFVVYPWASGADSTFFDHYSVTRTVEELFGLPLLAGAANASSLIGHFGLTLAGGPPTAEIAPACSGLTCTFDASGSAAGSGAGGAITSYAWKFGDGTGTDVTTTPGDQHTYAAPGTYSVTLTVSAANGRTAATTMPVVVGAPPVASFVDSCVSLTCSFDGSGSTSSGPLTYTWDFGDGSPTVGGATATHDYATAGTATVTLTVVDGLGASSSVSHDVTMAPTPVPAVTATCSALTCTLDGSGSTAPNSAVATFRWDFGDGSHVVTGAADTATHTYGAGGSYPVTLVVTNVLGTSAAATTSAQPVQPVQGATPIAFVASAATTANATTEKLTVPSAVSSGDGMLLIATSAVGSPQTAPPGWTVVQTASSALMFTSIWQRVASAGDARTPVTVTFGSSVVKGALQLLAYTGTSPAGPAFGAAAARTGVVTASSVSTPTTTVPSSGMWLLSCWSARSAGSTGWTVPTGILARSLASGSGGAHITSLVADSGGPVAAGSVGAQVGTTDQTASADIAWTLLLAPAS